MVIDESHSDCCQKLGACNSEVTTTQIVLVFWEYYNISLPSYLSINNVTILWAIEGKKKGNQCVYDMIFSQYFLKNLYLRRLINIASIVNIHTHFIVIVISQGQNPGNQKRKGRERGICLSIHIRNWKCWDFLRMSSSSLWFVGTLLLTFLQAYVPIASLLSIFCPLT